MANSRDSPQDIQSGSVLPLELQLAIIDHLDADKPALQACATVCQAWLRPSQNLLFRRVYVRASTIDGKLLQFSQQLSSSPELAAAIHNLRIERTPPPRDGDVSSVRPDDVRPHMSTNLLYSIVTKLPALRFLSFSFVRFVGGSLTLPYPSTRPSLEALEIIMGGRLDGEEDMVNVLHAIVLFSRIRRLSFSAMAFMSLDPAVVDENRALRNFHFPGPVLVEELDLLSFRTPWISFLYHALLHPGTAPSTLHTVSACVTGGWGYIVGLGRFLRAVGPALQCFKFNPTYTIFYSRKGAYVLEERRAISMALTPAGR